MDELMLKLRILASAEMNLVRVKSRRLLNRAVFFAIAAGLFLFAVLLLNVGAYQWLSERHSPSDAAFLVAGANAALGLILGIIGWRVRAGPEEQMAREVREMALDELTADVDELHAEVSKVGDDVKRIRSGFSVLTRGGQIGASLASFAPLIKTVVDAVSEHRKKKERRKEGSSDADEA